METLEQAEHYIEVLYICAYVGFALWGIAGWYVGRYFLRTRYIKPNELINMYSVRALQEDHADKVTEISELREQITTLVTQNKSLWSWSYAPHSKATFITITQQDKEGDEVAHSQISLPDKKHWVEPTAYADDLHEDFHKWKESLPHNQPED